MEKTDAQDQLDLLTAAQYYQKLAGGMVVRYRVSIGGLQVGQEFPPPILWRKTATSRKNPEDCNDGDKQKRAAEGHESVKP